MHTEHKPSTQEIVAARIRFWLEQTNSTLGKGVSVKKPASQADLISASVAWTNENADKSDGTESS